MPIIDDVKDADGRLAIQELMASSRQVQAETRESSGVIGLKTPLHPYQCRSAATMVQREVHPKQMLDPRLQAYKTPHGEEYYYDKEEGTLLREKRLYDEACGGKKIEVLSKKKNIFFNVPRRNSGRDHGLRENPDLFGSYSVYTWSFPSYSDGVPRNSESSSGVCRLSNANGSRYSWSILCSLA
jgi:hypothetical protein